jgi:hypothetical protein
MAPAAPAPATQSDYTLSDASRAQLDGIVGKMTANNEPDANVQAVVDDFKGKYGAPPLTPDQTSAEGSGSFISKINPLDASGKVGALAPANTENPGAFEPLKPVANLPGSTWNFAKGVVGLFNPISAAQKVGKVVTGIGEASDINKGTAESNQTTADLQNQLIQKYNADKSAGKDVSHLDAFFKAQGIDPAKTQTAAPAPSTLGQIVSGLPQGAYESLVPEAGRALISAGTGYLTGDQAKTDQGIMAAQRAIENDPVGSILPFLIAAKAGLKGLDAKGITAGAEAGFDTAVGKVGGAGVDAIAKTADIATKPIQYAFGKGAEIAKTGAKAAFLNQAGIPDSAAKTLAENPNLKIGDVTRESLGSNVEMALKQKNDALGITKESLGQEVQSAIAKKTADIGDTGKEYQPIRQSTTPIKVEPDFLKNTIQETTGLKISDSTPPKEAYVDASTNEMKPAAPGKTGTVSTNAAAKIRDAQDVRAVQNFYDKYQPLFDKGSMTTNEFLNMRADLGKLSKFERELTKSSDLEANSQIIRGKLNSALRPQVNGLSTLDKSFADQTTELKGLGKGIVDKNGTLTDSGLSKIAKASADKPQLIAQLEKISPGITGKIKSLQGMQDLGKGFVDANGNVTEQGLSKIANAINESHPQTLARLEQIKPGITKAIQQYKALQAVEQAGLKTGAYMKSAAATAALGGAGSAIAGFFTANPILLGGGIGTMVTAISDMILTSPENAMKIIQTYGANKPIVDGVISHLKETVAGTLKSINTIPENSVQKINALPQRVRSAFGRRATPVGK